MRAKGPYILIGILVGIIVMQWAACSAEGSSE